MNRTKKLKILMIAPTPYFADRGCHVRIYEEARALRALGHDVRICTYHLGRDLGGIPTWRTPRIPWYRKLSAGPSWHKIYLDIFLFFTAFKVTREFSPDLIHAHLHEGALVGFLLKKIFGIPMLFDCQGSLTGELAEHRFIRRGSWLYRVFRWLEGWIVRRAEWTVCSSAPAARILIEEFALSPATVTVVADGVDLEVFRPDLEVVDLRRELSLPQNRLIVVFMGVMSEHQGVDLLLEAIGALRADGSMYHFLLMGYPEEGYRRRAKELGFEDCVTFTGRIEYSRAAEYLNLGDLALAPKMSDSEANGKILNYMACGLPVIAFDNPVNRQLLGKTGIFVPSGNVGAFAEAVEKLGRDDALRRRLSQAVRETAVTNHGWDGAARSLESHYNRLLVAKKGFVE